MNTVAIVQARMGSTRLPGKIMKEILGRPMLQWCLERLRAANHVDEVVVATTVETNDDVIEELCRCEGWNCFRGAEHDVLDRYYQAARANRADTVVRVTSDCPLVDPTIVDHFIAAFRTFVPPPDYVSNFFPRTYPRGLDVEVFSFTALERAWKEDDNAAWREHVTPYLYKNPESFRLAFLTNSSDLSDYRLTVDTEEDLTLVRAIFEHMGGGDFSWQQVIEFLSQRHDLVALNRTVVQKEVQ